MNIVTKIEDWFAIRKQLTNQSIGLVHTMGNLHAGHMSLFQRSKQMNDVSVAAIFVNPTQFNQASDFERYPRTLENDIALLIEYQVDYLLLLDEKTLYPDQYHIQVSETETSAVLEGEYRPGHFTGMLTIVLKFLNIVQPTRSYYGEKDFQQLLLIKKMAKALFLPVEIIGCPTIRDEDELALSSRNSRLSPEQRKKAAYFPALLQSAASHEQIVSKLQSLGFKVDYIEEKWHRRLGAVWVDEVRLIDNIPL
jgi:pantoate--beta-alanine ligase